MKRILAIICTCCLLLTTIPVSASAEESKITVATADVISTLGYDTCPIYFQNNVALMSVSDVEKYTRAEYKLSGNTLTLSLGTRNISIDVGSGKLTEDSITATIKTVKYEDTVLLHAYPILTYLGATCGVENEKLIINMPESTIWEGTVRSSSENALDISEFGDEFEQDFRLLLNGILSVMDSGIVETLMKSSLKEAAILSMQVNPLAYDSALQLETESNIKYSGLLNAMFAANDFSADFSDLYKEGESLTKDLALDYFGYLFKDDKFNDVLDTADGLFTSIDVATSFLSNISANSKCSKDSLDMIRAFSKHVPKSSKYYDLAIELEMKVDTELTSVIEAATETAKVSTIEFAKDYALKLSEDQLKNVSEDLLKKTILSTISIWEKSLDISVILYKAFYGENNIFSYAEAETACINLLRLKNDLKSIIENLSKQIIKEKYSNSQNIEDYRLLNVFYYRVLIAANEQCKAMIIADGREEKSKNTINLLENNNKILAKNLYRLMISKGVAYSDISKDAKNNAFDNFKELRNKATAPTKNDSLAMYYLAIQNGQYTINNGHKYYTIQTGSDGIEPTGNLYKENTTTGERKLLKENTLAQLINVVNGNVFYTEYGNGPYNLGVHMISADGTYHKLSDDFILGLAADDKFVYYATDNSATADGNSAIYRINYLTNTEKETVVELNSRLDDLSIAKSKIVYSEIPAIVNSDKRIIIYDLNSKAKTVIPDLNIFEEMWIHANYIYILKWDKGSQLGGQGNKNNLDFLNRSLCRYNINKKTTETCQLPKADYEEIFNGYCVGDIYSNILDDIEKELPTNFNGSTKFLFK